MPKNDSRWIFYLLGRALTYALLGGLATALSGAVCIGVGGALVGAIVGSGMWSFGGIVGLILGGGSGALVGFLSFGIIGFALPPRRGMLPPRLLLRSMMCGQIAGTVACAASFFGILALISLSGLSPLSFPRAVSGQAIWVTFGAPAVMGCAQIAATFIAFRRYRSTITYPPLASK